MWKRCSSCANQPHHHLNLGLCWPRTVSAEYFRAAVEADFLLFQTQVPGRAPPSTVYIYITVSTEAMKNLLSVVFKNINDDMSLKRSHESRCIFKKLFKKQSCL